MFCRATGICTCGIGRKRCSSRPSRDTWACRSCSPVTWSFLLCCHLWVALVLSWCPWCRGDQDYHRICCVYSGLPLVRVEVCLSRVTIRVETMSCVGSWTAPTMTTVGALSIRLEGALCGYCEGFFRRASSNCPHAHPVPERFSEGRQHD